MDLWKDYRMLVFLQCQREQSGDAVIKQNISLKQIVKIPEFAADPFFGKKNQKPGVVFIGESGVATVTDYSHMAGMDSAPMILELPDAIGKQTKFHDTSSIRPKAPACFLRLPVF